MNKFIVAGIGTGVGKTLVSAIMTTCLSGAYWKPIQCGEIDELDTVIMKKLIDTTKHTIYKPAYSLKAPLSPHHAARLENTAICIEKITLPQTSQPLIIEGAGGIFVPLTTRTLIFDVFNSWKIPWVVVSRHYLGSINHTLLTLEALKRHKVLIAGIVFNGSYHPDSEEAILEFGQVPVLGRLFPEPIIDHKTIQRYAKLWQKNLSQIL